jgi:centromeric protein E
MVDEHINVAVRLRPLNDVELAIRDRAVVKKGEDGSLQLADTDGRNCRMCYTSVFDEWASSQDVFNSVVADMLSQAMLGKNATIFAYGQTGSGKTYTVEGLLGITADFLFNTIAEAPGREFLLKMSAVEVYNEAVHDLLQSDNVRLELVDNREGKTVVKSIWEETLLSVSHLHKLLRRVRENRKVRLYSLLNQILKLTI